MGCSFGNSVDPNFHVYSSEPITKQWKKLFEILQLSEDDVGLLYLIFQKMDKTKTGAISTSAMLNFLDVDRTKFTKRVFSMFDTDHSGKIDFREFVMTLWNYCTLEKDYLVLIMKVLFSFDLYDQDNSKVIDVSEVVAMLQDVYGTAFNSNKRAKETLKKIEELQIKHKGIDVTVFREFCKNHPALLYPAFQMQNIIKRKVVGEKFWERISKLRSKVFDGKFVPIGYFMTITMDNKNTTLRIEMNEKTEREASRARSITLAETRDIVNITDSLAHSTTYNNNTNTNSSNNSSTSCSGNSKGRATARNSIRLSNYDDPRTAWSSPSPSKSRASGDEGTATPGSRLSYDSDDTFAVDHPVIPARHPPKKRATSMAAKAMKGAAVQGYGVDVASAQSSYRAENYRRTSAVVATIDII